MVTATFAKSVKRLLAEHPRRKSALAEIEQSLSKLMKSYVRGWETETDLGIEGMIQQIEAGVLEGPEPTRSDFILQWTNDNLRSLVILSAFKAVDLTDGLVRAANERCFLSCALATRSLMELAAALCYVHDELSPYLSGRPLRTADLEEVRKVLRRFAYGGRFDWLKVTFDDPRKALLEGTWTRPRGERLPEIRELIDRLDAHAVTSGFSRTRGAVNFRYSALSDFVHPTAAALFFYSGGPKPGIFRLRQRHPEIMAWLLDYTVLPAYQILSIVEEKLGSLAQVEFKPKFG